MQIDRHRRAAVIAERQGCSEWKRDGAEVVIHGAAALYLYSPVVYVYRKAWHFYTWSHFRLSCITMSHTSLPFSHGQGQDRVFCLSVFFLFRPRRRFMVSPSGGLHPAKRRVVLERNHGCTF